MQEIVSFISNVNNLLLVVLWFVLLYMVINSFIKAKWDRTPQQIVQLMNADNSVILDVREDNELTSGVISDSIHIPLGQVKTRIKELEKYKNDNVIVSCRSGHRSSRACSILKKSGFDKVFNLRGGIIAWESDKLPLTRK